MSDILVDPNATGAYAYAAWSAWRGDAKQFAQIVRRAQRELTTRGGGGRCSIDVLVLGDCEHFDCPKDFVEQVSPQALAKFSAIRVAIGDEAISVALVLADRNLDRPFTAYRGVLLEVRAVDEDDAPTVIEILQAIVPAVSRGQFRVGREPWVGVTDRAREELYWANRVRLSRITTLLAAPVGVAIGITAVATAAVLAPGNGLVVGILGAAAVVVELAFVLLLPRTKPRFLDLLYPAVDIADVTPGWRLLRRLAALPLVPLATALIKALVENQ